MYYFTSNLGELLLKAVPRSSGNTCVEGWIRNEKVVYETDKEYFTRWVKVYWDDEGVVELCG